MIIKITVKDNNYTELIEEFFTKFKRLSLAKFYKKKNDNSEEFLRKYFGVGQYDEKINNLIYTEKSKIKYIYTRNSNLIAKYIKELFCSFVEDKELSSIKKYLFSNLQVVILDTFDDKDENGECVYYFASNNKFITL